MAKKTRIMSGTRTTGALHFGNYFGAIENWLKLQDEYECFFGVMDWHGMTTAYKTSKEINHWNRDIFAELIAWGIDTNKSTLFIQSLVPEHLELLMVFANLTPMGWLERVPSWKDAESEAKQSDTHNLGRFLYPVLQAADIALYKGEKVPVGADQLPHLELNREIIRRFNHLYKAQIPEPQALLTQVPVVPGFDGRKMSKSYGNSLLMTEDEKSLQKKVRAMPTDPQRVKREDPGNPEVCTVNSFHKLFSSEADLKWVDSGCRTAGIGCGDCKGRLIENVENKCRAPREKKKELLNNQKQLDSIIAAGCDKARKQAQVTLQEVKSSMGLNW